MSVTIEELQDGKKVLEKDILKLLVDFKNKFGIAAIEAIDAESVFYPQINGGEVQIIDSVKVSVKL